MLQVRRLAQQCMLRVLEQRKSSLGQPMHTSLGQRMHKSW